MAFDVFLSYSSKDKTAADAACSILEAHGIRCWVAPRDILPGADWGESIIEAINGCKLMVLIFSGNANASQQVKREVERVVNRGLPIIPVRIEDVLPSQALEYFLSTPHWLDAFTPPLERHLEHLAATVKQILTQPDAVLRSTPVPRPAGSPWKSLKTYITPAATTAAVLAALVLLALIAARGWDLQDAPIAGPPAPAASAGPATSDPSKSQQVEGDPAPPVKARSSLAGRWQGEIEDADGQKHSGLIELQDSESDLTGSFLAVTLADTFPFPLCDKTGQLYLAQNGIWDPERFRGGIDDGSFMLNVGDVSRRGGYSLEGDKTLVLRCAPTAELRWQRSSQQGPLSTAAEVLPTPVQWPVQDVAALARRSLDYVRSRWQQDAALLSIELGAQRALAEVPEVSIVLHFYSTTTGGRLRFAPSAGPGVRLTETKNSSGGRALPARFRELREVMTEQGLSPAQLSTASLEHKEYYDYQDIRANNAILPPCPYEKTGYYWILKTEQAWHYVAAEKP
jgi:hypothetical protein